MRHPAGIILATLGAVALAFLATDGAGAGTTITVSSTADAGPTTLRGAITSANNNPGADVITFDPAVFPLGTPATIALTSPLPEIKGSGAGVTIDGSNAGVIVDGSALDPGESGLVITSGTQGIDNTQIMDITVRGFPQDGVLVCGGNLPDCAQNVGAVVLDGITATDNGRSGIHVQGEAVGDVQLSACALLANGRHGAHLESGQNMTGTSVETCQADDNADTGVYVESRAAIIDFHLSDSSASDNAFLGAYLDSVEETTRPVIDNVDAVDNGRLGIGFSAAQPLTGLMFTDSTVDRNGSPNGNGVGTEVLAFQVVDVTVTGNSFSNNVASNPVGGVGFQVYSQFEKPSGLTISNNTATGNVGRGIAIITDTPGDGAIETSTISENDVSGNSSDGVFIFDSESVTISRNRISGNGGIGIDLGGGEPEESTNRVTPNDVGDADQGSNDLLNFPVFTGVSGDEVVGTACGGCTVELFASDSDPSGHGEGRAFLGEATTGVGGSFSIPVCGSGEVTATATDAAGNTSEFSANYALPVGIAPCEGQLKQGDVDCDGSVTTRDNQALLRFTLKQNPLSQTEPCPDVGTPSSGDRPWGDADCDGSVSTRDNQALLRFSLQQNPLSQTEPCPDVGSPV